MTQTELNDAEWRNPDNWHGGWVGIYVRRRDTRVWVPKRVPVMGWTLNMGQRRAWLWAAALLVLPTLTLVLSGLLAGAGRR